MAISVFKQHKKLLFSFAFFAVFSLALQIFAAPPTTTYSQGETLDPSCVPGSTNCSVSIVPQLTSGSILFSDGTTIAENNSKFFWDNSGNGKLYIGANSGTTTGIVNIQGTTYIKATPNNPAFFATSDSDGRGFIISALTNNNGGIGATGYGLQLNVREGATTVNSFSSYSNLNDGDLADLYINVANVGIGDATPASLLTVGSGDKFQVNSSGNIVKINNVTYSWPSSQAGASGYVLSNNGSGTLTWTAPGAASVAIGGSVTSATAGSIFFAGTSGVLQQDNSNFFWDDTNNRLGIGTTSPSSAFHISGVNTSNSQARIGSLEFQTYAVNNAWFGDNVYFDGSVFRARNAGTGGLFYFAGDEGQFRFKSSLSAGASWGTGFTNFKVNADGTVALGGTGMSVTNGSYTGATLVATGAGRVGIGTTSPSAPLHVVGTSGADFYAGIMVTGGGNIVLAGSGGNTPTINLYPNVGDTSAYVSSYYNAGDDAFYMQTVGLGTSDIILRNFSTGAKVVMDENGNFGIGDDTPSSLLTVGANDAFQINSSGNVTTTGSFDGPGFDYDTNGNVAITGTFSSAAASFAVDVNGAITAATGITSSGDITLSGVNNTVGSGDVVCIDGAGLLSKDSSGACAVSSQRFKHDIVSLPYNALDTVNALHTVNFMYNGTDKIRTGFIAEEVEQVNRDYVVYEADGVTPHGVYYIDMIPLLAKSIQELDLKISPITSLDTQNPNSLGSLVKQFLANTQNTISDLYAQIIHSDRVETKQLCIGETCVDENQLKQLLLQQGGGSAPIVITPVIIENNPPDDTLPQVNEEPIPVVIEPQPEVVPPVETIPQNDIPTSTE